MAYLTENILHPMHLLHELVLLDVAQYACGFGPVVVGVSVQTKYCGSWMFFLIAILQLPSSG